MSHLTLWALLIHRGPRHSGSEHLSPDELLTTTRAVRRLLDFDWGSVGEDQVAHPGCEGAVQRLRVALRKV